jgi:multimeric flavodoxin WrbA
VRVLVVNASPRRDGNSWLLGEAAADGARSAGHDVELVHLADSITALLRDCRQCRRAEDDECDIDDGYAELLLDKVVPADAVLFATPLHFYGMSGLLKTFFDRTFCYTATRAPSAAIVSAGLPRQRVGLLVACEESYRGATIGLTAQMQELTRYNGQDLVGVVVGIGNSRREVREDPGRPLEAAAELGRRLFEIRVTDYRHDTERTNRVWGMEAQGAVDSDED